MDSVREAVAGALAGAFSKTLLAPLDRLKLVVQLRGSLSSSSTSTAAAAQQQELLPKTKTPSPAATTTQEASYQSGRLALQKILQEEGFLALWRGNLSTIYIQAGTTAVNFVFLDLFKKAADQFIEQLTYHQDQNYKDNTNTNSSQQQQQAILRQRKEQLGKSFVSGALAGVTGITLLYPIGLMRTKLALDMGKETRHYPKGMRDVIRYTYRSNGIAGLYQGYGVALWSVTLYRMVYLGGYDFCKTELCSRHQLPLDANPRQLPFWERFLAAQVVSMVASTVHYPLDSVRRRLMMQSDSVQKKYRNGIHCFMDIYTTEGIRGFYRGLAVNYMRSVGAAILLVSYDFFKGLMLSRQ